MFFFNLSLLLWIICFHLTVSQHPFMSHHPSIYPLYLLHVNFISPSFEQPSLCTTKPSPPGLSNLISKPLTCTILNKNTQKHMSKGNFAGFPRSLELKVFIPLEEKTLKHTEKRMMIFHKFVYL